MAESSITTFLVVVLIIYSGYETGVNPVEALTCCIDNPVGSNCIPGSAQEQRCSAMCNLRCGKGLGGYCVQYPPSPTRYCHCNC
ncbi:hypothetical protein ACET3Z_003352 [Daucus carota]